MSSQATIRLAPEIVKVWRQALLRCAKLPRGITPKTHTPPAILHAIVKSEAKEVGRLWNIFTQEREDLSRHLLSDKRSAVAYLVGFHLANAARAQVVLNRAHIRHPLAQALRNLKGRVMWHDLGCGTGAVAQVVMHDLIKARIAPNQIEMHLSDLSGTLLDTANQIFKEAGWAESVHMHKFPLEKLSPARLAPGKGTALTGYSLGYVWNELARNKSAREALLAVFEERAQKEEDTLILVLEPAMQELARDAMDLRDTLVKMGYGVLYPCPHSKPCPMLQRTRDWCYSEATWEVPFEITRLDEILAMDRSRLSGAGYLMASPSLLKRFAKPAGASHPELTGGPSGIVVGRPQRTIGRGFDYLVCGPQDLAKASPEEGAPITLRGLSITLPESAQAAPRKAGPNTKSPKLQERTQAAPRKSAHNNKSPERTQTAPRKAPQNTKLPKLTEPTQGTPRKAPQKNKRPKLTERTQGAPRKSTRNANAPDKSPRRG